MSKELKRYKLSEITSILVGGDMPDSFSLEKTDLFSIPVYSNGEKNNGLYGYTDSPKITEPAVTISARGSKVGFAAIRKQAYFPIVRLISLIPNSDKLDVTFLYYNLKLNRQSGTGSGQPQITIPDISNKTIDVPNIQTQQKIASVLSSLDSKIELNNRINTELEAMAKTLYDYWFVQFDFPDANGKPYKSSGGTMVWNDELKREIPEGWDVKRISSIANFVNGKGIGKNQFDNNGKYCILGSNGIVGMTNQVLFSDPVIAIGRVGANYGEVHYSLDPCWISDNAVTAQPLKGYYLWWLIDTLKRINYKTIAGGSAQPLITQGQLKELRFAIPDDDLFKGFHKRVNSIYLKLNLNLKENQKLSELRDWLLPMLMNGQVKVK